MASILSSNKPERVKKSSNPSLYQNLKLILKDTGDVCAESNVIILFLFLCSKGIRKPIVLPTIAPVMISVGKCMPALYRRYAVVDAASKLPFGIGV
jgi:hypothetical protein